jgi:hypothetical protein
MHACRLILSVLGVALGALMFGSSAPALEVHVYSASFGEPCTGEPCGNGQFKSPVGVAVNDSLTQPTAGDVYVVDQSDHRVERFSSTGAYLGQFDGSGTFEVEGKVETGPAAPSGALVAPEWIAVDNSTDPLDPSAGDVYVTDNGHNVIDKFSATGAYLGQITGEASGPGNKFGQGLEGVAVDSEGRLWVYTGSGVVDNYSDTLVNEFRSYLKTPFNTEPGFAVDSEDNLYVSTGPPAPRHIAKIDSSGKQLIREMDGETTTGVAVDLATNDVYLDNVGTVAAFNPEGLPIERFGAEHLVEGSGIAVNSSSKVAYVADRSAGAVRIFTTILVPTVVTGTVTGVQSEGSATLNGTVNPEGVPVSSCSFEYGTEATYGNSVPCEPEVSAVKPLAGNVPVAVNANLSGLITPGTQYHYRLVAANANGEQQGEDHVFTAPARPTIEGEASSDVGSSIATLSARIGPGGSPAAYHVEYGTSQQYGSSTAEVSVGAGLQSGAVQVQLSGLQSGTPYHFRFVAENAVGTTEGADATFTTTQAISASALTLPDDRAYELVSSSSDNQDVASLPIGEEIPGDETSPQPFRAAADGNSFAYIGYPSAEGGNGAFGRGTGNQFFATRGASAWSTSDITPTGTNAKTNYRYFSNDLSVGVIGSFSPISSASPVGPPGCLDLYARTREDGGYHALFTTSQMPGPCEAAAPAGVSADDAHILYEAGGTLNAEVEGAEVGLNGAANLYDSVSGHVHLVNVLPDGQPEPTPTASFGSPRLGQEEYPDLSNVVSADGSRIFWTSLEVGGAESHKKFRPKALYVRENDTQPQSPIGPKGECVVSGDACTVQIDAGEPGCVSEGKCGTGGGRFWTANSDGSRVFFTDCNRLTAHSTAVSSSGCLSEETPFIPARPTGNDLYEYEVSSGRLTDLTIDHNPGDSLGADVQGVVGTSEDGSYVYFVAGGVLAPGAGLRKCTKNESQGEEEAEVREEERGLLPPHQGCNLYVRHDGVTVFIGGLLFADNNLSPLSGAGAAPRGDWRSALGERTAEVSADGHGLVFTSMWSLTGYDNAGLRKVFVYNALSGQVSCASCSPSGAPPPGSQEQNKRELGAYLPTTWKNDKYMERRISDDGSRVFFETRQSLAPQDTNGLMDVYEWERDGAGSCRAAASGPESGCIYLLSGGGSSDNSYLVDSDASGENVFFTSRGRLIPQAHNENVAMYDARVNGGFPVLSLACTGTGCQGVPPAPPIFATPSSTTFNGVGNFAPPSRQAGVKPKSKAKRCGRGFVRKHDRCVRQKRHKKAKGLGTRVKKGSSR